jgi:hypothetical protein
MSESLTPNLAKKEIQTTLLISLKIFLVSSVTASQLLGDLAVHREGLKGATVMAAMRELMLTLAPPVLMVTVEARETSLELVWVPLWDFDLA